MSHPSEAALEWSPARRPDRAPLQGARVRLEPIDPSRHQIGLFVAAGEPEIWRYLPYGPYEDEAALAAQLEANAASEDPLFYAIVDLRDGRAGGMASYLRITPEHGVIEIGHITPALACTSSVVSSGVASSSSIPSGASDPHTSSASRSVPSTAFTRLVRTRMRGRTLSLAKGSFSGLRGHRVTQHRVERQLAAILAADVAGYSRLMGSDEEGTLAALKGHRRALVDPKVSEHRGRIVKTTGDGMLVEFASVVDAVRCAADIQRGIV